MYNQPTTIQIVTYSIGSSMHQSAYLAIVRRSSIAQQGVLTWTSIAILYILLLVSLPVVLLSHVCHTDVVVLVTVEVSTP